jgi:hypothetical protein
LSAAAGHVDGSAGPDPGQMLSLALGAGEPAPRMSAQRGRKDPRMSNFRKGLALALLAALPALAARSGRVVETMNSGGYTYVQLETEGGAIWVAGPEAGGIAVGQNLTVEDGMPMRDFLARSLDRSFDLIYFINGFGEGAASTPAVMANDPHAGIPGFHAKQAQKNRPAPGSIDKAGYTVAELFFQPALLKGRTVEVRGVVTKFNGGILGSNWIHLVDGTGEPGKDDLVVTSQQSCKVGDTVLVEGVLGVDKDLGSGYFFPVIVEEARLTVEASAE